MEIIVNELLELFYKANKNLFLNHYSNILFEVSERNICAQLSMEINNLLKTSRYCEYYSDPEYNRNGLRMKKIIMDTNLKPADITCDLIVHSRGTKNKDNLIAIEMKKIRKYKTDTVRINKDRDRLKALSTMHYDEKYVTKVNGNILPKFVCMYEIGILYLLNFRKSEVTYEFYMDGSYIGSCTKAFDDIKNGLIEDNWYITNKR